MHDTNRSLRPHFGNPRDEYTAATTAAAVFDVSNRVQLELTGPDRNKFLHNFCTNNINAMVPHSACEAFLLNAKGRMLGHVFVFASEGNTWVESVPGQAEFLHRHLEKYHLLEEFKLENRTGSRAEFYVTGPASQERLHAILPTAEIEGLADRRWTTLRFPTRVADGDGGGNGESGDVAIDVKRLDLFGSPGFFVSFESAQSEFVWQLMTENGIQAAGDDVFQALRIEHALPVYGIDLSDDNLAQEAGRTNRAISFDKGCYLGQEPVARLNALGHVNREIARFSISSREMPLAGLAVLDPTKPVKEIGKLSSVAWSWERDCPVGLGLLRTQFAKAGTELPLADGGLATVF